MFYSINYYYKIVIGHTRFRKRKFQTGGENTSNLEYISRVGFTNTI